MSAKIYVGNLSFNTENEGLEGLFSQYGSVVSARVITDRETGRSRGFGFVEMASADEASAAIEALNNAEFDGRNLRVNEAEEKPKRSNGGGGSFGGGGGSHRNYVPSWRRVRSIPPFPRFLRTWSAKCQWRRSQCAL